MKNEAERSAALAALDAALQVASDAKTAYHAALAAVRDAEVRVNEAHDHVARPVKGR